MTETTKTKLYELLTGKKFNSAAIHKMPNDVFVADLKDSTNYYHETYHDEDQGGGDGGCATQ